jgi:hypothetical protein
MKKNIIRLFIIFISIVFMIQFSGCTTVNKDFINGNISEEMNSILITKGGVRLVELDGKKRETSMGNLMQERMEIFPIQPGYHSVGLIFSNSRFDSVGIAYISYNFEKGKYYFIEATFDYQRRTINYEIKIPAAERRGIEDFSLEVLSIRGNKSPAPPVLRPRGAGY